MNNVTLRFLAGLSLALVLTSCANRKLFTEEDAIRVASEAATDAGYRVDDYHRTEVTRLDENHWIVLYGAKIPPLPDGAIKFEVWNYFSVWVNERTEGAKVIPSIKPQ
jgi:hypothetical protein